MRRPLEILTPEVEAPAVPQDRLLPTLVDLLIERIVELDTPIPDGTARGAL
ncbi:MAG: hypothetical protein RIT81_03880 [Deltaproteobacteria bacterium]